MTPDQKVLARHALGLGHGQTRSYRNRYFAQTDTVNWDHWRTMVADGLAERGPTSDSHLTQFWLTRAGADRALDPGETLDPEDFPPIGAH